LIQKKTGFFQRLSRLAERRGSRASLSRLPGRFSREGTACPRGHAG